MTLNPTKFAAVVAAAKAKTTDRRWINAIDKAAGGVVSGWWIVTELADGIAVTTETGKTYFANGKCGCEAFKHGQPCKHRALARLIEMYNAAPDVEPAPAPTKPKTSAPKITRSVERDHFGARHTVVRFDGWMI